MTPEQYVKLFYPDAFCDYSKMHKSFVVAVNIEGEQEIIGKSEFFESIAWKNAKDWVCSQRKTQKTNR